MAPEDTARLIRLAQIVTRLPLTQAAVADALGVRRSVLSGWLRTAREGAMLPPRFPGRQPPGADVLARAEALFAADRAGMGESSLRE